MDELTFDEYLTLMFSDEIQQVVKSIDSGKALSKIAEERKMSYKACEVWKATTVVAYQQYRMYHAMGLI